MQQNYAGLSYEEVVTKFADTITRLCIVWTQNTEEAKDCFQNTFLKLLETQKEFKDQEHLKAWLICVAKNECRDLKKLFWNRKVELGIPYEEKIEELQEAEEREEIAQVVEALRMLPLKYREVLLLYYYEGYDTGQIAKMLHSNVNTIRSRMKRGREKLAMLLQEEQRN